MKQISDLLTLLVNQVILNRETSAHLIEHAGKFTDLIASLDRNLDIQIAAADSLNTLFQSADRPDEKPG